MDVTNDTSKGAIDEDVCSICGAALAIGLSATASHAQATRTGFRAWATISIRAAARALQDLRGRHLKTAPAGEINCLDPGAFGAVTITKAMTIICDYTEAGVLATLGSNGIIINAGASDVVILSGLDINGAGTGLNGIRFLAGAALHVVKSKITRFANASGNGISFAPSGTSELYVSDSFIAANGGSSTTGGINVAPTGTGAARVTLTRNQIENNTVGVRFSGTASTGGMRALLRDNVISGNTNNGVISTASTAATFVSLENNSVFANNVGIQSDGANSFMQISGNTVTLNLSTGMSATAGGTLQSYVNNFINFNSGGDGATAGANLTLK